MQFYRNMQREFERLFNYSKKLANIAYENKAKVDNNKSTNLKQISKQNILFSKQNILFIEFVSPSNDKIELVNQIFAQLTNLFCEDYHMAFVEGWNPATKTRYRSTLYACEEATTFIKNEATTSKYKIAVYLAEMNCVKLISLFNWIPEYAEENDYDCAMTASIYSMRQAWKSSNLDGFITYIDRLLGIMYTYKLSSDIEFVLSDCVRNKVELSQWFLESYFHIEKG